MYIIIQLIDSESQKLILWRVDPLLGNDRELSNYTGALNNNKGTVFSARSIPRCYKQELQLLCHESRGTRNQESPSWWGPAAIYWNKLVIHSVADHSPVVGE
jgi:hypothetical protein